MRVRGIRRDMDAVRKAVNEEISFNGEQGGIAAGLAAEGFAGGYRQALSDVDLALSGANPDSRYWNSDNIDKFRKPTAITEGE